MTPSGHPADDSRIEQEGIWEDASGSAGSVPAGAPSPAAADEGSGLTRRLTATEHVPGPAGLLYADVPNRIMALIVDIIVLSITGFVLAVLVGWTDSTAGGEIVPEDGFDLVTFLLVLVLQLTISAAYFVSLWTLTGTTVGMRLLGLRLGDESDGRRIGARAGTIRWLFLGVPSLLASLAVYVPNTIGLILGALGVAWLLLLLYTMAQSPARQGLHDRYAHTIVFKARRRVA